MAGDGGRRPGAGGHWTVEDHLSGQPAGSLELYLRFVEQVEACGPFTCSVAKTAITFKGSRRGFAGARPTRRGLSGYLDLQRVVSDPRIISSSPYTKRLFVHQVRITELAELDDEFAGWIAEAYAVGRGAGLLGPAAGLLGPAAGWRQLAGRRQ